MAGKGRRLAVDEDFWAKVIILGPTDCWVWTGAKDQKGYGTWGPGKRLVGSRLTHRYAYITKIGPIPSTLQIDHTCQNKGCVNPAHLEPVTGAVNVQRAMQHGRGGRYNNPNYLKTHCVNNHEFTPTNTYYHMGAHGRYERLCKACRRKNSLASYHNNREAIRKRRRELYSQRGNDNAKNDHYRSEQHHS